MNIIIPFKASYIKILMLFLFSISSFCFNKPSYGKYASIIMNEKSGKVYHSINFPVYAKKECHNQRI